VRCCWRPAASCICIFAVTLYFDYFIGFSILLLMRKCFLIIVTRIANFRIVNLFIYLVLWVVMLLNSNKNCPIDCLFCFCCCLIKSRRTALFFMQHFNMFAGNLIYIFFSIFYYCQKIYKDFYDENDEINGNKEISFDSSK
jgi:hypothetical protein